MEFSAARSIQAEIARETILVQDIYSHAYAVMNLAEIDVIVGAQEHDVEENLQAARNLFREMNVTLGSTMCEIITANLDLREGRFISAKTRFVECFRLSWGNYHEHVSYCLEGLGNGSLWRDEDREWASSCTVAFLGVALKSKEKLAINKAFCYLADNFLYQGDSSTAQRLYVVALEAFTQMDVHGSRAHCLRGLGDIAKKLGGFQEAKQLWKEAQTLFEKSSLERDVDGIGARLNLLPRGVVQVHGTNPQIQQVLTDYEDFLGQGTNDKSEVA